MDHIDGDLAQIVQNRDQPGRMLTRMMPVQPQFSGGVNYSIIPASVKAAEAWGIPQGQIVPVYQAFGGRGYAAWTLPTASQEQQILATWGEVVPQPAFDYAYSWGTQADDSALVNTPALQSVFAAHNSA